MRVEDFNEERKTAMLCVVIANVIFMIGDCLEDAFGAGLNAFDLLIIDLCRWQHSKPRQFQGINGGKIYLGAKKHVKAFLRTIPVFAVSALLVSGILQIIQ